VSVRGVQREATTGHQPGHAGSRSPRGGSLRRMDVTRLPRRCGR
jgi:hypothetical protein